MKTLLLSALLLAPLVSLAALPAPPPVSDDVGWVDADPDFTASGLDVTFVITRNEVDVPSVAYFIDDSNENTKTSVVASPKTPKDLPAPSYSRPDKRRYLVYNDSIRYHTAPFIKRYERKARDGI